MNYYEKLPTDFLIAFYYEMRKNIEKGLLTKNMYVELNQIISVTNQRSIVIDKPHDFEYIINQLHLL